MSSQVTTITQGALAYLTTLSIEVTTVFVLFVLLFFIGFRFGKQKLVTLQLTLYIGLILTILLPYSWTITELLIFDKYAVSKLAPFLLFTILGYIATRDIVDVYENGSMMRRSISLIVLSATNTLVLIVSVYVLNTKGLITEPYSFFDSIFLNPTYLFYAFTASLVGLFGATR